MNKQAPIKSQVSINLVQDGWRARVNVTTPTDGTVDCIASHGLGQFRYAEYKDGELFLSFECVDKEEMFETFLTHMTARVELNFWSFRFLW